MKLRTLPLATVFVIGALALLAGCGGGGHDGHADAAEHATDDHAEAGTEAATEAAAPLEATPEIVAVLAVADGVDGTEDHTVAKCAGCALGMDGKAEHAMQVGDYEMHFCSKSCQGYFEEKGESAILAMGGLPKTEADTETP